MKYKVGDKVRIRIDLNTNTEYDGIDISSEMEEYRGRITTIKEERIVHDGIQCYKLAIDTQWAWTQQMFQPYISQIEQLQKRIQKVN